MASAVEEPSRPMPNPQWLDEIELALPVCAHFVLHGNVKDIFLTGPDAGPADLIDTLWNKLEALGYEFLLVFDRTDGVRVLPERMASSAVQALRQRASWLQLRTKGGDPPNEERAVSRLPELIHAIHAAKLRCALVVENASRLVANPRQLEEDDYRTFAACERRAQTAQPFDDDKKRGHLFNPVFWLANRLNDMPDWFSSAGERIRIVCVAPPDFTTRRAYAARRARVLSGRNGAGDSKPDFTEEFAVRTEGLSLRAMLSIAQIAQTRGVPIERIADAVRYYKVGVPRDPWGEPHLRARIRSGQAEFQRWVIGQENAIRKTLDILTRSILGLSGAQAKSASNRPRGVLFFAGPTGVGKTELAKAISRLVFGDADNCIRFDMSEFAAEHADARLIGAPPGYIGHDAGGELVNAVRQKPFSVLLFDEIEKAHPRLLDKFLQIIEDGRITDGHGDTVHFSECIIIFTSNLGVSRIGSGGAREASASPNDPFPQVERRIRDAIEDYFRHQLQRPELLNRIGENIVVFDFIRPAVAEKIFAKALASVVDRVREAQKLQIDLAPDAHANLKAACTKDLTYGGRGIGNQIEARFINPLARALFDLDPAPPAGGRVTVVDVSDSDGAFSVSVKCV